MKNLVCILSMILLHTTSNAQIKSPVIKTVPVKVDNDKIKPGTTTGPKTTGGGKVTSKLNPSKTVKANKALQRYMASLPQKTYTLPGGRKSRVALVNTNSGFATSKKNVGQRIKSKGKQNNCETIEVSISAEAEDFDVPYENASSYIYPGAVYLYSDYYANNVSPKTLNWARNPIFVQAASASTGGEYKLVEDPTRVNLNNAVGTIKNALNSNPTNLNTSIKMMSVYDESDFRFKVNAGGAGMGFKADASFGLSRNANKSYFMIDVKQLFYTISAILPENDSATVFKDMANNQNREALFMSTVNYGRRVLGVVETEFESEQMAANFKASYSAGFAGGHIGLDMLNGMKREKTTVKLFFVGGQANAISIPNPTSQSVMSAINNYLSKTTTQNAVPVSFTFRNMAMDPMRYESATDKFTYEQCTPIMPDQKQRITVTLQSITNNTNGGEKINLGIYQDAILYINGQQRRFDGQGEKKGNEIKNYVPTPITEPQPLVFWAEKDIDDIEKAFIYKRLENATSFKGNLNINKSFSITLTEKEIMDGNASVDLITRNITMYGFSDNHDFYGRTKYKRNIGLKEVLALKSKEVLVDINHSENRRFTLRFLITAQPVQ